jgi:hypothetical protein
MAKFTSSTALAHRSPIVVHMPTRRRRAGAVAKRAGRAVRHVARRAAPSLPLFGTLAAAAALGYLEAQKKLSFVPTVLNSRAATFGLIGFGATRLIKNPTVRMVGIAAAICGAFDIGRVKGGGVSGFDDDGGAGRDGGL